MKIDHTARIEASLASGVPFPDQLTEALASGKRFFIASRVDGKQAIVYEAPEELADILSHPPQEKKSDLALQVEALQARVAELEKKVPTPLTP